MEKEQRKRVLTDADIEALADALKQHSVCHMGLTSDEVSILKRILSALDNAAGIIGKVVLTAIVGTLIAIFTKGFWMYLITGTKQIK